MDQYLCPKGHISSEPDYCSECGAKMQSATASGTPATGASVPPGDPEHCPDCGTPRDPDIAFCEICGYNFVTGAHGDPSAVPPLPPPVQASVATPAEQPMPPGSPANQARVEAAPWTATLDIDPTLHEPGSPLPPNGVGPNVFPLAAPVSLIGRRSEARGIFPEIPVAYDDAVSHRHALLQLTPEGALTLRDIGSSNGTRLNGTAATPMTDYPLQDGDVITFGHWSRLTLARANDDGTSQPSQP